MDFTAPKAFVDLLPEEAKAHAQWLFLGSACIASIIVLMIVVALFRLMIGRDKKAKSEKPLTEDLREYPDLKSSSGDKQLRVEGVPCRLRLVIVAPAGNASEVDLDELPEMLDKIVLGLGDIYKYDKPRVKEWPAQVSYKGFASMFHSNMKTGAEEGEQTRWVLVAGRMKVGKQQYMLGVAVQTIKPNTIGQRTVDSHEWPSVLRVRVKE